MSKSSYTPEFKERLRALWDEGLSLNAIGRRVGISRNAVTGLVHRGGFPSRESPIKPGEGPRPARLSKAERLALLGMASAETPPPPPPAPVRVRVPEPCCFPLRHANGRRFVYCDAPSLVGKPYCQEHWTLTHIPPKENSDADRQADR